jgi:hypothetical protein
MIGLPDAISPALPDVGATFGWPSAFLGFCVGFDPLRLHPRGRSLRLYIRKSSGSKRLRARIAAYVDPT